MPEPVFVPRGEQLATTLIDGAAARPRRRACDRVVAQLHPAGLSVGLSVPVSADGVADVALTGDAGQLDPAERAS